MDIQAIKQRFGIIGNSSLLNQAIDIARQVAPTDITVLITGESGTGKEVFPKIIHQLSARKHGPYIAVNCGAIPEGTIDSELFGHEKGSFTGAHESRKGYFEVVNGGTIFLDEVAELPLSTQVRLLRVLESGEFLKVGSSKVIKTDVRVVVATNVNIAEAIQEGKFRQDLFYRLNTVPINIPPLRDRKEDIILLFRKFALDFAERYHMPPLRLDEEAMEIMINYRWQGNVRQLKNLAEQMSIIEEEREVNAETMRKYLPASSGKDLPVLYKKQESEGKISERELLYKVLFDMKKDISDLKRIVSDIVKSGGVSQDLQKNQTRIIDELYTGTDNLQDQLDQIEIDEENNQQEEENHYQQPEVIEESLSLRKKEIDLIKKALEKHHGKRKDAAKELGISERTLYRKIKEYNIK
ncbi:MAG: sigma-54 dependent transcriptional regulator [Bacteroidales bacterium]|nr:sigma-54 dependent transcriptional regulator [Bacteroidales bacterium]MCF8352582.1 sigma-54 dependent transcriptional regulator [Bacteroidales bacterium]MCF8376445.1 sigma-54 dependent transcriptional regulator [Bacteroidales bacterium]MCF8400564.1 sigma-54 dependent transcriptional regulator [Bacteroidales bacterium]